MLEQSHEVSKLAAMPHYPAFSSNPDYWMYGSMRRRKYVYYYLNEDRLEDRGASFHRTDHTRTFRKDELKWISEDDGYYGSWACD
jgi:hypothetical protein